MRRPQQAGDAAPFRTLLLCGYCNFGSQPGHPLLLALPSLRVIRAEELHEHAWLRSTLDQLSSEYMSQWPASGVVIDRLTEILLIGLIRLNFGRADRHGFIGALYDKPISRALALLHEEPSQPWTLDDLAARVAMSRAAFAKRFRERIGQTMFEYVTRLRMQKAQDLLRNSTLPLYEVARRAGYQSDLAFTKAFKKLLGMTPTKYRKQSPASAAANGEGSFPPSGAR